MFVRMGNGIKYLYKKNVWLFLGSLIIFLFGIYTGDVNKIILYILEFTVIFELVRAFNHYIKDKILKVRYGIDAAIFFVIKELYIGFSEFKISHEYNLIILSLLALVTLMGIRWLNSTFVEEKRIMCEYNDGSGNCTKV